MSLRDEAIGAPRTPPGYKGAINRLLDELDAADADELRALLMSDDIQHWQVRNAIEKNFGVRIRDSIIGTWRRDHGVKLR